VDPSHPLVAALVVLVGALIQGFLGFGYGIVAMSGLTLAGDLVHAAGVVNVTDLLLTGSLALRMRRVVLWRVVARVLPGALLGVLFGVTALGALDREWMVRLLGASIVAVALWNVAAPSLRTHEAPLWDGGVGLLAGLLSGAFNTGGPPLVAHLYRRREDPLALKATIQASFLAMSLARLPTAAAQGLVGPAVWRDALLAAPLVLAGAWCGAALAGRISAERMRRGAWLALGVLGVALLVG
jgi:hypothetical protein